MTPASARPTVSVVIPVKDDATPLRRCLEALATQTRRPDELVVVDNGSDDASGRIARAAGARVVRCDEPGIPAAAAAGYDAARGRFILRLDADCRPGRTWVERIVGEFERRPGVAALTGGARFVDGPRMLRAPLAAVYLGAYAAVGLATLGHPPLFGSNLAVRRNAWLAVSARVHRSDPELHDDLDLAFHLGDRFRIGTVPGAEMGISMRPLGDRTAFARRVRRGFRTVLLHWPTDLPPVRWVRLALRRGLARVPSRRRRLIREMLRG